MKEIQPMSKRLAAAEEFLESDPDFVCGYGRQAKKQGRVSILPYLYTADMIEGTNTVIEGLQSGFAQKEKDVCLFVFPEDNTSHWMEYFRTWVMYARTHTAASSLRGEGTVEELAPAAASKARYFFSDPERLADEEEYVKRGIIPFGKKDQLMVMNTSPAYPQRHPRKTPVAMHIITRLSDATEARKANIHMTNATLMDAIQRTRIPYSPIAPYVVPNDMRFALPSFRKALLNIVQLQRELPINVIKDPIDLARQMSLMQAERMTFDSKGKLIVDTSGINREAMLHMLLKGGHIDLGGA